MRCFRDYSRQDEELDLGYHFTYTADSYTKVLLENSIPIAICRYESRDGYTYIYAMESLLEHSLAGTKVVSELFKQNDIDFIAGTAIEDAIPFWLSLGAKKDETDVPLPLGEEIEFWLKREDFIQTEKYKTLQEQDKEMAELEDLIKTLQDKSTFNKVYKYKDYLDMRNNQGYIPLNAYISNMLDIPEGYKLEDIGCSRVVLSKEDIVYKIWYKYNYQHISDIRFFYTFKDKIGDFIPEIYEVNANYIKMKKLTPYLNALEDPTVEHTNLLSLTEECKDILNKLSISTFDIDGNLSNLGYDNDTQRPYIIDAGMTDYVISHYTRCNKLVISGCEVDLGQDAISITDSCIKVCYFEYTLPKEVKDLELFKAEFMKELVSLNVNKIDIETLVEKTYYNYLTDHLYYVRLNAIPDIDYTLYKIDIMERTSSFNKLVDSYYSLCDNPLDEDYNLALQKVVYQYGSIIYGKEVLEEIFNLINPIVTEDLLKEFGVNLLVNNPTNNITW